MQYSIPACQEAVQKLKREAASAGVALRPRLFDEKLSSPEKLPLAMQEEEISTSPGQEFTATSPLFLRLACGTQGVLQMGRATRLSLLAALCT